MRCRTRVAPSRRATPSARAPAAPASRRAPTSCRPRASAPRCRAGRTAPGSFPPARSRAGGRPRIRAAATAARAASVRRRARCCRRGRGKASAARRRRAPPRRCPPAPCRDCQFAASRPPSLAESEYPSMTSIPGSLGLRRSLAGPAPLRSRGSLAALVRATTARASRRRHARACATSSKSGTTPERGAERALQILDGEHVGWRLGHRHDVGAERIRRDLRRAPGTCRARPGPRRRRSRSAGTASRSSIARRRKR